jgi:hypothetical protein
MDAGLIKRAKDKKKKEKKKHGLVKKLLKIVGVIVVCFVGCLLGYVVRRSSPVVVPIVKDVYTDMEDTTITMDGVAYSYNIYYTSGGYVITSGGTTDDSGDSGNSSSGTDNSGDVNATESDYESYVYQYLTLIIGYDDVAAAAIMGNMSEESHINPSSTQKTHSEVSNDYCMNVMGCTSNNDYNNAHGLVQWDGERRNNMIKAAKNAGYEWNKASFQMGYIKGEVEGGYSQYVSPDNIRNGYQEGYDELEYLTYRWCRFYEVCYGVHNGDTYESRTNYSNWENRYAEAQRIKQKIDSGAYNS